MIDDARLEEALRELGGQLFVPEPPDAGLLTEKVLARLDEEPPHRSRLRNSVLLRVAAVVVVALVALAVLIAVQGVSFASTGTSASAFFCASQNASKSAGSGTVGWIWSGA